MSEVLGHNLSKTYRRWATNGYGLIGWSNPLWNNIIISVMVVVLWKHPLTYLVNASTFCNTNATSTNSGESLCVSMAWERNNKQFGFQNWNSITETVYMLSKCSLQRDALALMTLFSKQKQSVKLCAAESHLLPPCRRGREPTRFPAKCNSFIATCSVQLQAYQIML